jgi:hypothetical protein
MCQVSQGCGFCTCLMFLICYRQFRNFAENTTHHGWKRRIEIVEGAPTGSEEVPLTSTNAETIS